MKGIDPKAREIAKDLARRAGMTLGEWLNQMIIDGGEVDAPPFEEPPQRESSYRDPSFRDQRRGYAAEAAPRPRFYDDYDYAPRDFAPSRETQQLARLTHAFERLSARMEAAEHRSTLAISGIDQSVMGVLSRMEGVERDQTAMAARFDGALDELHQAHGKTADRLRKVEQDDAPRVEAMKAMETALSRLATQLYDGETRTRESLSQFKDDVGGAIRRLDKVEQRQDVMDTIDAEKLVEIAVSRVSDRLDAAELRTTTAMRALETSFAELDKRLGEAENGLSASADRHAGALDTVERRLERLAADLSEQVAETRNELAEKLKSAASSGKIELLEQGLNDLAAQVDQAEHSSAQAIDKLGREVVRVAESLGQRVTAVEAHSKGMADQLGGEMARLADAMEKRVHRADDAQAEALERLGEEIARIAEKLSERIASSERRSSQAIDDVADQVQLVAERSKERYDRAGADLVERIRQSEQRTAKLLEEAQARIDARLSETRLAETRRTLATEELVKAETPATPTIETAPASVPAPLPERAPSFHDLVSFPEEPAGAEHEPAFQAEPAFHAEAPFHSDTEAPFGAAAVDDPFLEAEPAFEAAPHETAAHHDDALILEQDADDDWMGAAALAATAPAEEDRPLTEDETVALLRPEFAPQDTHEELVAPLSTRDLIAQARAAAKASSGDRARPRGPARIAAPEPDLRPNLGFGRAKKKPDSGVTLKTTLLATGVAATATVAAVGLVVSSGGADLLTGGARAPETAKLAPSAASSAKTPAAPASDTLAVAVAPEPAAQTPTGGAAASLQQAAGADAAAAPAKPAADAKRVYEAAESQINAGEPSGLEAMKRAANLGYGPAQFFLAKLYEDGRSGVAKDEKEARRWTERAAQTGVALAEHNLGYYYFDGVGGVKDRNAAATWFRRAAEQGVVDSQYNLARLYELGEGVPQNSAEAYKWYLLAAAGGDQGAQSSAEKLKRQLPPEAVALAQKFAQGFHARPVNPDDAPVTAAKR